MAGSGEIWSSAILPITTLTLFDPIKLFGLDSFKFALLGYC